MHRDRMKFSFPSQKAWVAPVLILKCAVWEQREQQMSGEVNHRHRHMELTGLHIGLCMQVHGMYLLFAPA